VRELSTP